MNPRVLYIGGTGRSGSTVLAGLLAERDGRVAVGELRYVWRRSLIENQLCQCGAPFRDCPFWIEVLEQAFGRLDDAFCQEMAESAARVDRIRHIPWLAVPQLRPAGFQYELDCFGDALRRLYSAVLRVSGASVVVDSSKDPSYAYLLRAQPSLDLSLVHLVRDSRAVAYSWTRQKVRPEIHWKVEYMQRRSPFVTARRWNQYNLMMEALARRTRRSARIRYEDLVGDPASTLAGVETLPGDVPLGPESGSLGGAHAMSGNPARFEGSQPIRADTEWMNAMPARDRRLVTAITAPLLLRYGYLGPRATARPTSHGRVPGSGVLAG